MPDQEPFNWSEGDVRAAIEVLDLAVPGQASMVISLTDECIRVLDGLQNEQVAPTPWLDDQDEASLESLAKVALRSMLLLGLVVPVEDAGDDTPIQAIPLVTGSLVLRRTAERMLILERTTSDEKHWVCCYLHAHDSGVRVLEEDIYDSGFHNFTVYPLEFLGERLKPFLDPNNYAVDDWGFASLAVPEDQLDETVNRLELLSNAESVTTLSSFHVGNDTFTTITVLSAPDGVTLIQGQDSENGKNFLLNNLSPKALLALSELFVD
jgi:hypothetical protein